MEMAQQLGAILRVLQVVEIEYSLSGGGDSGETTLERIVYRDPPTATKLPDIPVRFTDDGRIVRLPDLLEDIVADAPEGDWVNNEGGYGTVYVRPFEDDSSLAIECDMTYRDDGDYGDDDHDDEFVDDEESDLNEAAISPLPVIRAEEIAP
ncbi:hypothetical protein [Rhodopseudomonas parapalustris]